MKGEALGPGTSGLETRRTPRSIDGFRRGVVALLRRAGYEHSDDAPNYEILRQLRALDRERIAFTASYDLQRAKNAATTQTLRGMLQAAGVMGAERITPDQVLDTLAEVLGVENDFHARFKKLIEEGKE